MVKRKGMVGPKPELQGVGVDDTNWGEAVL